MLQSVKKCLIIGFVQIMRDSESLYMIQLELESFDLNCLKSKYKKRRMVKDEGTNRRSHDGTRTYHGEIPNQLSTVEKEEA